MVLYPNPCYNKVCYTGTTLYLGFLYFRQTKKSTWDVGRSMRYNQDAQRSEGIFFLFDSLHPSQQFFSYAGMGLPGLNQY